MLDQPEVDQIRVYDKKAELVTGSADFDGDGAAIHSAIKDRGAIVFNEHNHGIAPERRLTLEIGVHPDKFDALLEWFRGIGHLDALDMQQQDRTGEFRRLHAQRQSLKKYLETVEKLRGINNPSIDDTLKLEQKIQDVEKELQSLSVQLGDLLGKESFYHIQLTLYEYRPGSSYDRTYTLPQRLGYAFLWAVAWWFAAAFAVGVLAATFMSIRTLWPKPYAPQVEHSSDRPAT